MELTPNPGVHKQGSLDNVVSANGNTRQKNRSDVKVTWLRQMVENFFYLPPALSYCNEAKRAEAAKLLQAV